MSLARWTDVLTKVYRNRDGPRDKFTRSLKLSLNRAEVTWPGVNDVILLWFQIFLMKKCLNNNCDETAVVLLVAAVGVNLFFVQKQIGIHHSITGNYFLTAVRCKLCTINSLNEFRTHWVPPVWFQIFFDISLPTFAFCKHKLIAWIV